MKRYKGRIDSDADEFIGYAVDGARRMQALINDLLAYSRVGRLGKPLHPTDSDRALNLAIANLGLSIRENGARITTGELPCVEAHERELMQVFQNLLGNAIKFRGAADPDIRVDTVRRGDFWEFSVADNGIGIAAEHHDRIFEIFQRLHRRNEKSGTGIGLAICQRIIEQHGGRIWVESSPGAGAAFHFTLRAANSGRQPSVTAAPV